MCDPSHLDIDQDDLEPEVEININMPGSTASGICKFMRRWRTNARCR